MTRRLLELRGDLVGCLALVVLVAVPLLPRLRLRRREPGFEQLLAARRREHDMSASGRPVELPEK